MARFAAIDFETADHGRDSACAVAVVRVERGAVVRSSKRLIRPPRRRFAFTGIHGITWPMVEREPDFAGVWPEIADVIAGVDFLVAHNAAFDRSVLRACCAAHGLPAPATPFHCSVRVARAVWDIRPTKLPDVCRRLGLPLSHHDPLSDATACAHIVVRALDAGWSPGAG